MLEAKSTNRGYTGHEHLDELDVIHMNARVYDPDTGRFLSADPTVPDAANPQAFNRYAYALNNPLSLVDRNGFKYTSPQGGGEGQESGSLSSDGRHGDRDGGDSSLGKGEALGAGPAGKSTAHPAPGFKGEDRELVAQAKVMRHPAQMPLEGGGGGIGGLGAAGVGTALGMGAGKAVHSTVTNHVNQKADEGQSKDGNAGQQTGTDKPSLLDPKGETHVLDGDATGGGHAPGTGKPGKSEFPSGWSRDKITGEISDVATDPSSTTSPGRNGRTVVNGTRDGVDIQVIVEPNGRIVTGYPTNVPRNPR